MKSILHSYYEHETIIDGSPNYTYTFVIWPDYMREDSFVFERSHDKKCDVPRDISIELKKLFGDQGQKWKTRTWFLGNNICGMGFMFRNKNDALLFKLTFI